MKLEAASRLDDEAVTALEICATTPTPGAVMVSTMLPKGNSPVAGPATPGELPGPFATNTVDCINLIALAAAQAAGDVLTANGILMDAFYTDVRSDLAAWRESRGLPADPMRAYLASGYQEQIEADRVGGSQAGWN